MSILSSVNAVPASSTLTPAAFQVLVGLADGGAHGYAVMKFVEDVTGGATTLPAGTLYRTLSRLRAEGLVEETGEADPSAPHDARRRYYRLTPLGVQRARDEAAVLWQLVRAARDGGLLPEMSG